MTEPQKNNQEEIDKGLKSLRRRRKFFLAVIIIYVPMIWLVVETYESDKVTGVFFLVWLVLLIIAVMITAFVRCPACGNYFHMMGFTPLYPRNCLHCGLHVSGDEKKRKIREPVHYQ